MGEYRLNSFKNDLFLNYSYFFGKELDTSTKKIRAKKIYVKIFIDFVICQHLIWFFSRSTKTSETMYNRIENGKVNPSYYFFPHLFLCCIIIAYIILLTTTPPLYSIAMHTSTKKCEFDIKSQQVTQKYIFKRTYASEVNAVYILLFSCSFFL